MKMISYIYPILSQGKKQQNNKLEHFFLFILLGNHSTIWKHNLDSPLHNVCFCVDQKSKIAATTELSLRWTHLCKWINYFFSLKLDFWLNLNCIWIIIGWFTAMFSFFVWSRMTTTTVLISTKDPVKKWYEIAPLSTHWTIWNQPLAEMLFG